MQSISQNGLPYSSQVIHLQYQKKVNKHRDSTT